jgi:hypothetical protein
LTDGFRLVAGGLEGGNEFEVHKRFQGSELETEQEFCFTILNLC